MNKYIIFSLISLPIFCADLLLTGRPFIRINEETSTYESAYRSYISADGKTTIQLIGMTHAALPQFFQAVQGMTAGKVTLYELDGVHSLEDEKKIRDRVALLGDVYKNRWKISNAAHDYPDALGCIYQNAGLSYDGCAELIHADDEDKDKLDIKNFLNASDERIKQIVNGKTCGLPWIGISDSELDEKLDEKLKLFPAVHAAIMSKKALSSKIRRDTQQCLEDVDLVRSGKPPIGYLIKTYGARWEYILLGRNEFIFEALRNVWSRKQVPSQISIPYGAAHLQFVEDFLLKNGYQPIKGSDGWLVAAKLCPLTAANSTNATHVKKVYLSADGLMKIYLIGSSTTNDELSERDRWFVRSRIFGWEKSQKGELVEMAYTPDDMDYVAENLLRSGFVLIKEVPFVRKDNRKRHWHHRWGDSARNKDSFEAALENNF